MKPTNKLAALCTTAVLTMASLTGASAQSQRAHAPHLGTYYMALGDSLSVGEQPEDPTVSRSHGWVYGFRDRLDGIHHVEVLNLAIGGECSDTFVAGGRNADCPTMKVDAPSQLAEAVAMLKAYPGMVDPITVEVGGDNLNGNKRLFFGSTDAVRKGILGKIFPQLAHDWAVTFGTLRAACPTCTILALNQYSPFPAGSQKVDVRPVLTVYSGLLTKVATASGVKVVDIAAPFVGKELAYTWIAKGDIHATSVGYATMAASVWKASGYAQ